MMELFILGPALVFEGEESMLAAISADPMSFKVISFLIWSSSQELVIYLLSDEMYRVSGNCGCYQRRGA